MAVAKAQPKVATKATAKAVPKAIRAKKRPMSDDHREALAQGRTESSIVRQYLDAISVPRGAGRKRTPETLQRQIAAINEEMKVADPHARLLLTQERKDLEAKLAGIAAVRDIGAIERRFIKVAKSYSDRKGINYSTWRESGVSAEVLKEAGIARTRKTS